MLLELKEIEVAIEDVREQMHGLANVKGLLDPLVIEKSQELDQLLNRFSQFQKMNKLA